MNGSEPQRECPDLHGDDERWPDGLGEPGEYQAHNACEHCGCSGASTAVRFVPVDEYGGGVLTEEEIADILERAKIRVLRMAEAEAEGKLSPLTDAADDDVVLRIEGYRDGTFRAAIPAKGGDAGRRTSQPYGRGTQMLGFIAWQHGLVLSKHITEVTDESDKQEGIRVFHGKPGALNFTKREAPPSRRYPGEKPAASVRKRKDPPGEPGTALPEEMPG